MSKYPTRVPLSPTVSSSGLVFISGQLPDDFDASIDVQTRQVLDKIAALLESQGGSIADIVKTTVFLSETSDFDEMNRMYGCYFPGRPPARSTIRAGLMVGAKIEIDAIAVDRQHEVQQPIGKVRAQ